MSLVKPVLSAKLMMVFFLLTGGIALAEGKKQAPKKESAYDKLAAQNAALQADYEKLQKDYQALALDRDNLILRAKSLLSDTSRMNELEEAVARMSADKDAFRKEKESLENRALELEKKLEQSSQGFEQLSQEKKKLEDLLSREKDKSRLKKLEEDTYSLQKQNIELKNSLRSAQAQLNGQRDTSSKMSAALEEARQESAQYRRKIDDLNRNYADAVKKNRLLEQKALTAPEKVSELARQNKTLVRQTANMHYNLGVFYTKNKEYSRAVAEFEEAVKLRPDDAYAHFNLGYIYAEYLVNRARAIEHFRHYLRVVKGDDKDTDWVKKYILTWQAWEGKQPME